CALCPRLVPSAEQLLRTPPSPEACDVALDALRLLVRDGADAGAAAGFARQFEQIFAARADCAECMGAARALHNELSARATPAPQVSDPNATPLRSITVYGAGADDPEVRVVLAFDAKVEFRRSELQGPRRIAFDFERVRRAPELAETIAVDKAGLGSIHTAAFDDHTTRVIFEVQPSTQYHLFFLPKPYRLVLDFRPLDTPEQRSSGIRTIVLDPGHGGAQAGARAADGLAESEVALAIALRVRKVLAHTLPEPRVVLTRERDQFVSLEERAAIANALGADLFVSIHLNAAVSPQDRGGMSTHVLDITHDPQSLGLAARENEAGEADMSALLPLMTPLVRRDQVAQSLDLAQAVHRAALRNARRMLPDLVDRGVRRALFYVLVGARMPAILCEASFLSRPEEAEALATDQYRQLLAEGIAEGIARYVRKVERARSVLGSGSAE
ncbi:MAG TPA: N-acetylmuramoyl-L-alanine amidase, partial [Polyangiales bacterium]|nr:N-acetylmuramoyl-L-alanine amidase [Polyangiales bacterium]